MIQEINNRAGSVLTETEEPAVFDDFLGTETEIEPISAEIRNREQNRNRSLEPRVPETADFGQFFCEICLICTIFTKSNQFSIVEAFKNCLKCMILAK